MLKRVLFLAIVLFALITTAMAQVTTSGINGKIVAGGESVIGATIRAVHLPSGTNYGTITNADGRFTLQGMRVGGPYKVEISYVGYQTAVYDGIALQLGETYPMNVTLKESAELLNEVVITAKGGVENSRTGAATSFNLSKIENLPTISRSVTDITRLTPQATVNSNGAISFAGANNRYNSFQIDGAMNNDVFGLTSNGTNGGQASAEPVSLETIEQIQVNIAPYDVRQSGFTGGGVNAITKSGTNLFHGSAYFYGNNQNLIGTTAGKLEAGETREKYQKQNDYQWGFTFGGPIIKDKLFFFANYEKVDKSYPTSNNIGSGSAVTAANAQLILDHLDELTDGAYSANFDKVDVFTRSDKVGAKIDWNINDRNKFTARYSYVGAEKLNFSRSANSLSSSDQGYVFNSKTHSFVTELNSRIGDAFNNELRASYVRVRDNRDPQGDPFPYISISKVDDSTVYLGTDYSSCANSLNQDIFSLTDNFNWLLGNHSLTFGTHNELYTFENLFIQNLYGAYAFSSLDDFLNDNIYSYNYGQSIESVTGTKNYAPNFSAMQLGFYVQDKWDITDRFNLTYGIRMDVPMFLDTPTENTTFNDWEIAKQYGVKTNRKLSSSPLISPRVGFRYYLTEDHKTLLRGGTGIFTGRIPFVWLSNSFSNTGVEFMKYYLNQSAITALGDNFYFNTNPDTQYAMLQNATPTSTTEVDVFAKDFKFAQNFRSNLALETMLPGDVKLTLEGIYSKTLNDVVYRNINAEESGSTLGDTYSSLSFDQRPLYTKAINSSYTRVVLLDNTSKGYTYNLSAKLEKSFRFGLDAMIAYTYGQSKSVNSGGSSVAWSNYQYNETTGHSNDPELSFSDYNIPHRIVASLSYGKEYAKHFKTTVSLIYQGQSGSPFNVCYYGDVNTDGGTGNDLIFIPTDTQIDAMDFTATTALTADQQRTDLKSFLGQARYLKDHRGEYFERNSANMPFEHHFDLRIAQDYKFKVGETMHKLQLTFDIMNVGNLLNREWGTEHYLSNNSYSPITYKGSGKYQYTYGGDYDPFSISDFYSRWRAQIGLKYTF
jgi:hypothetical protein